ncbi:hypothetical protein Tco_0863283, partial [Tanacetum coccineum]
LRVDGDKWSISLGQRYASFNLRCDGLWEETHGVFGCAKLFLYYGKSRRKIRVLASDYYNCRDDKAKELQSVKAHQNDLPTVFVFVILELRMRLRKFRGRVAMWEGGKIINYIREPQNTYARPRFGSAAAYITEDAEHENEVQTVLPTCFPSNGGRIYLDGRYMRFQNYNFFDEYTRPNATHSTTL